MATNRDKFFRSTVGSSGKISDFSPVLSPRGDFTNLEDLNVILNSWNVILYTPKGTVDHDPEFGIGIHKYLFEPVDDYTMGAIKNEIISTLRRYDDRAYITDVSITPSGGNGKGYSITIKFSYEGKDSQLSVDVNQATYLRGT